MSTSTLLIPLTLASTLTLTLTLAGIPAARADGEPTAAEEKVFQDKELTRDDRKFLLDEAPALEKYEDARSLYADYQKALGRLAVIVQYDETVKNMQMEQQELQQQVNMLQAQINSAGTNGGRMQRYLNAQVAPLRAQQSQARSAINQINTQLQASKSQAPKAEERKTVPALVERTRLAYVDGVRALDELVSPLLTKYHDLAHDKTVLEALEKLKHRTTRNYKLGPSDELVAASKLAQRVKKQTTPATRTTAKKKAKPKATSK